MSSISGLVNTSALTAVEKKICFYDTKISQLEKELTNHKHDIILLLQNLIS